MTASLSYCFNSTSTLKESLCRQISSAEVFHWFARLSHELSPELQHLDQCVWLIPHSETCASSESGQCQAAIPEGRIMLDRQPILHMMWRHPDLMGRKRSWPFAYIICSNLWSTSENQQWSDSINKFLVRTCDTGHSSVSLTFIVKIKSASHTVAPGVVLLHCDQHGYMGLFWVSLLLHIQYSPEHQLEHQTNN